jgi:uncharacterized protein (TIGR00159 family)
MISFIDIRFIDIIDIILVAFLMFQLYRLVRGTIAFNIIISILSFVVFWILVKSLKMELTSGILDKFVNIGLLALIVIFQQEIRRFFLLVGSRYNIWHRFGFENLFESSNEVNKSFIDPVVKSCEAFSESKTGALMVITRRSELKEYQTTGEMINSLVSSQLLGSIFFKNSPLHDGAVIISNNLIKAAACILPVSQRFDLPKSFGLRHRAAIGITETTDAIAVVVSEETGNITLLSHGEVMHDITPEKLRELLQKM